MMRTNWKVISLVAVVLLSSTFALLEYRRINVLNDRLGCAAFWLEKAKGMHMVQMKEPSNFTGDTMRKLMDSVDSAYYCATKDPSSGHPPGSGAFGEHGDMLPHK
jgi:hypothetical protein